jgi:hypothetical protein
MMAPSWVPWGRVDQFILGVEVLNVGNAAPATEPLCASLQAWLSSLDADQLITQDSRDADDGIESLEWTQGSWRLVFEAYPSCLIAAAPAAGSSVHSALQKRTSSMT